MSKQQDNLDKAALQDSEKSSLAASRDLELAYADALLDQVDIAQLHIYNIQSDIALLETMENALCLISENMARVRRLARDMLENNATDNEKNLARDEIRNLMMVNMLIAEDTEFNGHLLFKDDVLSMCSCDIGELTLTTSKIPDIGGVETGDFQAILDSLDGAARIINRQYQRISKVMLTLLDTYRQLRSEIDILLKAYPRQSN